MNHFREIREELRHYRTNLPKIEVFLSDPTVHHIITPYRDYKREWLKVYLDGVAHFYIKDAIRYANSGDMYNFRKSIIMSREIQKIVIDLGYHIDLNCIQFDKELKAKCRRKHVSSSSSFTEPCWSEHEASLSDAIDSQRARAGTEYLWCH